MPDRYGDDAEMNMSPQEIERRAREHRQRMARMAAQARLDGIAHCDLCDNEGYFGGSVCDHVDHREAAKRGMAMVRAAMGWKS